MARAMSMIGLVLCCIFAGCSTVPSSSGAQRDLMIQADGTLERFRAKDSTLADRIAAAHGYAVFPNISKGGAGIGGAFGRGIVYEQGEMIGFATVTQGSIGFQLGGQFYSELILFDPHALTRFMTGEFSFGAGASAVAATVGAAANANFENGVMVFTLGQKGLMYEAVVGGQKFTFEPR